MKLKEMYCSDMSFHFSGTCLLLKGYRCLSPGYNPVLSFPNVMSDLAKFETKICPCQSTTSLCQFTKVQQKNILMCCITLLCLRSFIFLASKQRKCMDGWYLRSPCSYFSFRRPIFSALQQKMTTSIHKLYATEMLKASKYNAASGKVD